MVNGDCAICRGATAREGAGFRRRKCFWLEPANNIATYREAQEHYGSVRIPANTKAGRAAAAGGTQADHGVEDISFAEIDTHELERRILGQMIVQLRDEAGVSDDAASNYTSLLALTVVAFDRIGDQYPTGSDLRAQWLVALDVVHGILIGMRNQNEPFGRVEVLTLLLGVDTYTDNIFQ